MNRIEKECIQICADAGITKWKDGDPIYYPKTIEPESNLTEEDLLCYAMRYAGRLGAK